jgi:ATP-binding cassette subfamily B protein RaxB
MNMRDMFSGSSFGGSRKLPLIMQTEAAECGLACIAMIGCYHGHELNLPGLRRCFSTSLKGVTLVRMIEIAHALGFEARGLKVQLGSLDRLTLPCILHWDLNHFVVLQRISSKWAEIQDPARGSYRISIEELGKHFTGVAMEMRRAADFKVVEARQHISLRALTGHVGGLKRVLIQVFGLALAIEILALTLPFQMQWVMDNVLVSADENLLQILALGFLTVILLQTGLLIARGWVISWIGATLNAQWITNLFGHLMRLPLDFFEKRHMGDVTSRFLSIRAIQTTLTGSFIETVLDGLMGSFAFALLIFYSLPLTCVVAGVFATYSALRWLMYHKQRRLNEEQLVYHARQDSALMESVRGVRTIKLANKQSDRRARLANATIESAARDLQLQRLAISFAAINQGLFGIQRVLLISLGAWLCLKGTFSAGMIVAYIAYADQFGSRIGSVIDKVVEFQMLRLHTERVADIALSEVEQNEHGAYTGPDPEPSITIRNLSFRYAVGEQKILSDLNLHIEAGESVAIVGAAGSGKSTLAKIILGLLEPSEGSIEIGGIDIRNLGLYNYRTMVAAVLQDDQLFAGTIADNISFFDERADIHAIQVAAKAAAIHNDIASMPMGYETLVGDMGSSLSGGQKQRVILARALFRSPKILVLDEATSHLDVDNEHLINSAIKSMDITRIVIAHRPETIASANRVLRFVDGRLCESGPRMAYA